MKLVKAAAVFLIFLIVASKATALSDKDWAYAYAITHELSARNIVILERIMVNSSETFSEEYLDIFAEVMLEEANKDKPNLRKVNTFRNILFKIGNHRYNTALLNTMSKPEFFHRKVKKFADTETGIPKYIPGSVDLNKYREEFYNDALNSPVLAHGESKINSLKPLITEYDDLIAVMGQPQAARITSVHGGPFSPREQMAYFYKGVGKVVIGLKQSRVEESKWLFVGGKASKFEFEPFMPYFSKTDSQDPLTRNIILYSILHEGLVAVRTMSGVVIKYNSVDTQMLDTFAELLSANYKNTLTGEEEDACAWVVKLLAAKNGSRYKSLIDLVANSNTSEKLTKYATRYLSKIEKEDSEPYKPGSVDIEKLKNEYLWPYS
jgi:hypothetical protein